MKETNWTKIDVKLAANCFDGNNDVDDGEDSEWMDEDAGWKKTLVTILVPFHHRTKHPGPQQYVIGNSYHCSLVSVI